MSLSAALCAVLVAVVVGISLCVSGVIILFTGGWMYGGLLFVSGVMLVPAVFLVADKMAGGD